jgi:hypothetical protein
MTDTNRRPFVIAVRLIFVIIIAVGVLRYYNSETTNEPTTVATELAVPLREYHQFDIEQIVEFSRADSRCRTRWRRSHSSWGGPSLMPSPSPSRMPRRPSLPASVLLDEEAAVELEAAAPGAAPEAALAGAPDQAPAPEADTSAAALDLAFANGSTSDLIVEHFIDSAESGDQSMNAIKAALPHIAGNTIESAVRRLAERGRLLRVSPGLYRLGPEKPAEPAAPPQPESVRSDGMTNQDWLDALEAFFADPASWDTEKFGPSPDHVENNIPHAVKVRMNDRLRKREERRRDREAALAKQAEADRELRGRLIAGSYGNFTPGPGLDDVAPIRAMLQDVDIQFVMLGLKRRCDRRIDPQAPPLASWREPKFLESVARAALIGGLLPRLVEAWAAAGTAQAKPASASQTSPATTGGPRPRKRTSGAPGQRQRPFQR